MGRIRRFAEFNRGICQRLERRWPGFFVAPGGSKTYVPELTAAASPIVESGGAVILEVGGIDRPLLERSDRFRYVGLDIETRERCGEVYDDFLVQSVESPIAGDYDLIFSQHLLEHVPDNRAAARAIHDALKPEGLTCHYVPNRGHPYALLLRLIGHRWQQRLLGAVTAEEDHERGGYKTFFDECSPGAMAAAFEDAGCHPVDLLVYYSPTVYFRIFVPFHVLMLCFMHLCQWMGLRYFASGFIVYARRPAA